MNKRREYKEAKQTFTQGNVEREKEKSHFLSPKKKSATTETIQKNGFFFFEMTGKYVKGEDEEGTEKG